jgi:hypothetical protein
MLIVLVSCALIFYLFVFALVCLVSNVACRSVFSKGLASTHFSAHFDIKMFPSLFRSTSKAYSPPFRSNPMHVFTMDHRIDNRLFWSSVIDHTRGIQPKSGGASLRRGPENGVQALKIDKLSKKKKCYFTSKACICPLKPLDLMNIFFISYTYTFECLFL